MRHRLTSSRLAARATHRSRARRNRCRVYGRRWRGCGRRCCHARLSGRAQQRTRRALPSRRRHTADPCTADAPTALQCRHGLPAPSRAREGWHLTGKLSKLVRVDTAFPHRAALVRGGISPVSLLRSSKLVRVDTAFPHRAALARGGISPVSWHVSRHVSSHSREE
jgi:hypothetical protein